MRSMCAHKKILLLAFQLNNFNGQLISFISCILAVYKSRMLRVHYMEVCVWVRVHSIVRPSTSAGMCNIYRVLARLHDN